MIPIVGVSLEEALLGFGDDDAELHDKEVVLITSDIIGSQTAVFEYDPQNEAATGTPPGPWDGYSLFTIDLSGVKDDIEDLQQQIADLEDELEACHDCRDAVVAALQVYDPTYDPAEGECPADKVEEVVDKEKELEEQVEECDQCKADVIAKLQEYDPDFDPQTCADIPPEIDKIVDEHEWYDFPEDTPYEDIEKVTGMDTVEVVGNDYYWTIRTIGRYGSYQALPRIDFEENAFYVATPPTNYNYGSAGWQIKVYEKATGDLVWTTWLGNLQAQGFDAGEYCKLISLSINYTAKTMTGVYEETNTHTPVQHTLVTDMSRYITVQSPNPRYKVKNS